MSDPNCTCEKRSWYGEDHDSACPVTIIEDMQTEIDALKERNKNQEEMLNQALRSLEAHAKARSNTPTS